MTCYGEYCRLAVKLLSTRTVVVISVWSEVMRLILICCAVCTLASVFLTIDDSVCSIFVGTGIYECVVTPLACIDTLWCCKGALDIVFAVSSRYRQYVTNLQILCFVVFVCSPTEADGATFAGISADTVFSNDGCHLTCDDIT